MGKTVLALFLFLFVLPVVFITLAFELGPKSAIRIVLEDFE